MHRLHCQFCRLATTHGNSEPMERSRALFRLRSILRERPTVLRWNFQHYHPRDLHPAVGLVDSLIFLLHVDGSIGRIGKEAALIWVNALEYPLASKCSAVE